MAPTRKWRFTVQHQARRRTWLWARFAVDGKLEETSSPQPDYRKALLDAMTHGLRPTEDCVTVDLEFGAVHFPSGRMPVYVGHGSALAADSATAGRL